MRDGSGSVASCLEIKRWKWTSLYLRFYYNKTRDKHWFHQEAKSKYRWTFLEKIKTRDCSCNEISIFFLSYSGFVKPFFLHITYVFINDFNLNQQFKEKKPDDFHKPITFYPGYLPLEIKSYEDCKNPNPRTWIKLFSRSNWTRFTIGGSDSVDARREPIHAYKPIRQKYLCGCVSQSVPNCTKRIWAPSNRDKIRGEMTRDSRFRLGVEREGEKSIGREREKKRECVTRVPKTRLLCIFIKLRLLFN